MSSTARQTVAIVLDEPKRLSIRSLELPDPGPDDVVVAVEWSGISTGTEKLLWTGEMPPFPGMGYPLVPGYETVGHVVEAGPQSSIGVSARVFVPGARCFGDVRGLFGGAASKLVVSSKRAVAINSALAEQGVLLALAATAHHAILAPGASVAELIVGHGVLGRLIARIAIATGAPPPVVWERNPLRAAGGLGYSVINPEDDPRRDYSRICDVSGDAGVIAQLISRLAKNGEITLAGFYSEPISFAFPPAFIKEARLRVAAEWAEADLIAVRALIDSGKLSLDGLISHRSFAANANEAYNTAFSDPLCLKMILDWRGHS